MRLALPAERRMIATEMLSRDRGLASICVTNRLSLLIEETFQLLDTCHDSFKLGWRRKDHG